MHLTITTLQGKYDYHPSFTYEKTKAEKLKTVPKFKQLELVDSKSPLQLGPTLLTAGVLPPHAAAVESAFPEHPPPAVRAHPPRDLPTIRRGNPITQSPLKFWRPLTSLGLSRMPFYCALGCFTNKWDAHFLLVSDNRRRAFLGSEKRYADHFPLFPHWEKSWRSDCYLTHAKLTFLPILNITCT